MNRRGDYNYFNLIWIVLSVLFLMSTLYFVYDSSSSEGVYGKFYAKKIALVLNHQSVVPYSEISINFSKAIDVAKENNLDDFSNLVMIDNEGHQVAVSLGERTYTYPFYSDYIYSTKIEDNLLIIYVKENA